MSDPSISTTTTTTTTTTTNNTPTTTTSTTTPISATTRKDWDLIHDAPCFLPLRQGPVRDGS
eukprot:8059587-Pyramimonas_sp.AAC.1